MRTKNVIRKAYKTTLQVSNIEDDTNFFDAGGDSLSAIRCIDMIERKLKVSIPIARLMNDSFCELCDFVQSNRR